MITRRGQVVRFLAITAGSAAVFSAGLALPTPDMPCKSWEDGSVSCDLADGTQVTGCRDSGICRDSLIFEGCTYYADGSGECRDGSVIPPLTEFDADFCGDVDPRGTVITWCRL